VYPMTGGTEELMTVGWNRVPCPPHFVVDRFALTTCRRLLNFTLPLVGVMFPRSNRSIVFYSEEDVAWTSWFLRRFAIWIIKDGPALSAQRTCPVVFPSSSRTVINAPAMGCPRRSDNHFHDRLIDLRNSSPPRDDYD
jgi:hypothetical protein